MWNVIIIIILNIITQSSKNIMLSSRINKIVIMSSPESSKPAKGGYFHPGKCEKEKIISN